LETSGFVLETVSGLSPRVPAKNGKHRETILALLRDREGRSGAQIAKSLGVSRQAIHGALKRLEAEGRITFVKKGRGSLYVSAGE
jgi:predicted ArsR family transcriptional regulator